VHRDDSFKRKGNPSTANRWSRRPLTATATFGAAAAHRRTDGACICERWGRLEPPAEIDVLSEMARLTTERSSAGNFSVNTCQMPSELGPSDGLEQKQRLRGLLP
jgi:hypothetical protein